MHIVYFERSSPAYINALTNIPERSLVYYRKALQEVYMILVEVVSELWKGDGGCHQKARTRDSPRRGAPFPGKPAQRSMEDYIQR